MKKFHKTIIILAIIFGIILILFSVIFGKDVVQSNRRVWLRGAVIKFDDDATPAAIVPEYFVVSLLGDKEITVQYSCLNTKIQLHILDHVEVLGFATGKGIITVCDNEESYIKKL